MAELINNSTQEKIFLTKYHVFGRKKQIVHTLIDNPSVSRIHLLVEWKSDHWVIHNKSRNGVWLNNQLINIDQYYPISQGDNIALTKDQNVTFTVANIDAPIDRLIRYHGVLPQEATHKTEPSLPATIELNSVNLLPSEKSPEVIIYYSTEQHSWMCENAMSLASNPIQEGDIIGFAGTRWLFYSGASKADAETIAAEIDEPNDLKFIFHISQDEEHANLKITHNNVEIDLDVRSHHYLTALLARYKKKNEQSCPEYLSQEDLHGWIPIKKLAKDLGLSETHINIQIHRARKQMSEKFQRYGLATPVIIERRRGYARFASDNFRIFKGNQLEN